MFNHMFLASPMMQLPAALHIFPLKNHRVRVMASMNCLSRKGTRASHIDGVMDELQLVGNESS